MSEMSLEERALRHADEFFDTEDKWFPGNRRAPTCVGLELLHYRDKSTRAEEYGAGFKWASGVMDVPHITKWNDALPSFKAMKSALKVRIKYYKALRTGP